VIELGKQRNMLTRLCPERETLEIEIYYGVRHEMAITLDDVLFRRTGLGTIGHPGDGAVARCADLMGDMLDWDDAEKERQIAVVQRRYDFWRE